MSFEQYRLPAIALSGRVLGVLFYYSPDHPDCASLLTMLSTMAWVNEWPVQDPELRGIALRMAAGRVDCDMPVNEEYQRLFIGPHALPAPPWGSVYLDKENVLFGHSMLELRQWMRERGFAPQMEQNEPEDHFGLLLMLAAWLADRGEQQQLDELLALHLFSWAFRYLSLFSENAVNGFYRGLGQLACITLQRWQQGMPIPVANKA